MGRMEEILTYLYFTFLGIWIATLFVTIFTGYSLPMWIALFVMNVISLVKICIE